MSWYLYFHAIFNCTTCVVRPVIYFYNHYQKLKVVITVQATVLHINSDELELDGTNGDYKKMEDQ